MRYYSKEHLWIDIEENCATIGICKYFIIQFLQSGGDVYVSVSDVGKEIQAGDSLLTLESNKSTIDFSAPVTGIITGKNTAIIDTPSLLSSLSEEECWVCRIETNTNDFSSLMTREEYDAFVS